MLIKEEYIPEKIANKHSLKEHKYERITTYLLLLSVVIIAIGIIQYIEKLCFYILIPVIFSALLFRILAGYHHIKERKIYRKIKS